MQFKSSFSNKNEDYYGNNQSEKAGKVKGKAKGPKTIFKLRVIAIFSSVIGVNVQVYITSNIMMSIQNRLHMN